MGNTDDDKDFEKFLMESITASEPTTPRRSDGLVTGRSDGKNFEWNLTSSEDLSPRKSNRFLKAEDTQTKEDANINDQRAQGDYKNEEISGLLDNMMQSRVMNKIYFFRKL